MAMSLDNDAGAYASFNAVGEQMTDYVVNQPATTEATGEDTVVRLRGLPFSATEEDVEKFFEGFDIVPGGIILGMSTFRARPNGDAYVMFGTGDEREKAMAKDRQQIGSRYIELFRCTAADFSAAQRKRDAEAKAEEEAHVFTEGPEDAVLRMRGLPFQAVLDNVLEFFNGYGLAAGASSIQMIETADGRSSGEAYVQFNSVEECKRAQEQLNKQNILSRYVELFESTAHEARQAVVRSAAAKKNYENNAQDVYVRVRGLPFSIQYREIRQFFSPAHIVSNGIHLMHDHMGRIRGDAYIQFVTPEDAKLALTKNRETLQSRYVEVFQASRAQMVNALQQQARFNMGPAPYMQGPMAGPQGGGPMYRSGPMYRAPATAMYGGGMQQQQSQPGPRYAAAPYPQPNRNAYHQQQPAAQNQGAMYGNNYNANNYNSNNYSGNNYNPPTQRSTRGQYNQNYAAQQGYSDYVQQQQQPQQQYYGQDSGSNAYSGYDNSQTTQWSYGYASQNGGYANTTGGYGSSGAGYGNSGSMGSGRQNW